MAVAQYAAKQNGREGGVINFRVTTHFTTSRGSEAGADLRSLTPRGVYLVSDYPPRPGDILRMGNQATGGFVGTVDYVERLEGSRWGFFVSFENGPAEREATPGEFSEGGEVLAEPEGVRAEAFEYYDRLGRVREYVSANYAEEITLEAAASVAALEKTYFSAFFHEKVGVTFCSWLQSQRVRKAIESMEKNNASITEIAFSSGFSDLRTFQRAFRKWTGMTAREYKKQVCPGASR